MKSLNSVKKSFGGLHYFSLGWKLIFTRGIKRFVFIPLLINVLLMGSALWWLFDHLGEWRSILMYYIPSWLQWLSYLLWPIVVLFVLLLFGYFFNTLANWIAAPFNGLLAEQLEAKLTGMPQPNSGISSLVKELPRMIHREWQKFIYYLPRILLVLVISLIPSIGQALAPILLFLFGSWMTTIQYCDYPFDNNKISFSTMRQTLQKYRFNHLQFGALVNLFTLVPILNMVIMPVAVCGATAMWMDYYKNRL